jgi:nitroreductase
MQAMDPDREPTVPSTAPSELVRPLLRVRQVRDFTDEPVTQEQLDALADVARWSGSSRNGQPWRFITIRDAPTLRRIHEVGLPQTRLFRSAVAAVAIVLPVDSADGVSDVYDDGRVAERLLVGAAELGLTAGIAWIMPAVRPAIAEILGLPADRFVRTFVGFGHPTEAARGPKSAPGTARLPRVETVFAERWPGR